jgi:hypothetical protein
MPAGNPQAGEHWCNDQGGVCLVFKATNVVTFGYQKVDGTYTTKATSWSRFIQYFNYTPELVCPKKTQWERLLED